MFAACRETKSEGEIEIKCPAGSSTEKSDWNIVFVFLFGVMNSKRYFMVLKSCRVS